MMEYLYGELSKAVEKVTYEGKESATAAVIVDNENNTIQVNVIDIPAQLLSPKVDIADDDGEYILVATLEDRSVTYRWSTIQEFISEYDSRFDDILQKLSTETSERVDADSTLDESIRAEVSARQEADLALQSSLADEAQARSDADKLINENLASEIESRQEVISVEGETVQVGKEDTDINFKSRGRVTINNDKEVAFFEPSSDNLVLPLNNNDRIVGKKTDGFATTLVFVSNQDKVEVGDSTTPLNLNTSEDKVLVNNKYTVLDNRDKNELDTAIKAEESARTTEDSAINAKLDAESNRAQAAEQANAKAVENETARATTAEGNIDSKIEALDTELSSDIAGLHTELSTRFADLEKEDDRLEGLITQEAQDRASADTELSETVNSLDSKISAETQRALAAEQVLTESIDDTKTELQTSINNEVTRATQAESELSTKVNTIESKIPTQASADNQLADKAFVNSSISNIAAEYITPDAAGDEQWPSLSALRTGPWYSQGVQTTPTKHDYAIYIETDNSVWRATYDGTQWDSQYKVNDAPFTQEQLSAINSGITSDIVALIDVHLTNTSNPHQVTATQVGLGNVNNTSDIDKPVSTAQASAIADAKKAGTDAQSTINSHTTNLSNPHQVTKTQIGLENVDNIKQYSAQNPPPYPVTSVASRTGAIVLTKSDVGLSSVDNVRQYSSTNPPPYPVSSVNNETGAVVLTYGDLNLTVNGQTAGAQSIHAPRSIGEDNTVLTSENGSLVWKEAQASTSTANLTSQAAEFGQSARSGTLDTAARSDHYHALPTPTASQIKSWMGSTAFDTKNIPAAPVTTSSNLFGGIRIHSWDEANGILDIRTT